jgi:AraC-like DNA-binding protein
MLLNVSILGFILAAIILLFSSYRKNTNAFLAAYLLFSNLFSLIYYIIFENGNATLIAIFSLNFTPFYFLTLPFLYLYVISHRKDFSFKPHYLLFFLPFVAILINISPYLFLPFAEKLLLGKAILQNAEAVYQAKLLFLPYYYQSLLRPVFNLVFLIITCTTYYKNRQHFEFHNSKFNERNFVFAVLLIAGLLNCLSFTFIVNKWLTLNFGFSIFSNVSFKTINSIFNYFSAGQNLLLLFFPQILFREQFVPDKPVRRKKETTSSDEITISSERLMEIDQLIQNYIQDHPYLSKGFTITIITQETGIPAHQISIYFKDFLHTNFNDWKNKLRIEFTVEAIKSGKWSHFTIEAIAEKSGFSSRSNFNIAFNACMNQTPSQFIKELNRKS